MFCTFEVAFEEVHGECAVGKVTERQRHRILHHFLLFHVEKGLSRNRCLAIFFALEPLGLTNEEQRLEKVTLTFLTKILYLRGKNAAKHHIAGAYASKISYLLKEVDRFHCIK